jgi:hypothetical protein
VRAIAGIAGAAECFVGLTAQVNIGRSPLPDITALLELASFARRLPFIDGWQSSTNPTAIRRSVVEIHQDDGIVVFALRITAVAPILRRRVACRQNEFEILTIRNFGRIECCGGEEINRGKKRPEVTQAAWASQFKISHHRFFSGCPATVIHNPRSFSIPPRHFAYRSVIPDCHSATTGRIAMRPYLRTCSGKMFCALCR